MDIAKLTTLVAILDKGSFAAAAQQVGCTPSAVSLQVKQLETYFGQPLFDRAARAAKPTAFAAEVAALGRDFGARLEALRTRPALSVAGRLRLGAIASVQTDALPQALRTLRDRHAALDVQVTLNDSDLLLAELQAGRLDAAVLVRPQAGGSSRLLWANLAKQPYVMIAPAETQLTSPQDLLQRFKLIRYDPALTGGRIAARYLQRIVPRARTAMDVRSIDAIVAMVSAGLGVSIVPQPRRALLDAHQVREVRLGRRAPTRQIAVVRRRADADNRNIDAAYHALLAAYAGGRPARP